jgi:hypothetical protein
MWKAVEKLRLREVHQGLPLPVTAAIDTATATMEKNRVFQWSMTTPFLQGITAAPIISPFWGRLKNFE